MKLAYHLSRWLNIRRNQLDLEPYCKMCRDRGILKIADVVDHVIPHKGDEELFFDQDNLQSLCKRCHDKYKQCHERNPLTPTGRDGYSLGGDR